MKDSRLASCPISMPDYLRGMLKDLKETLLL
jgi:hypothetical protein